MAEYNINGKKKYYYINGSGKRMNYVDKAESYFSNNFNCCQAVFTTFATDYGMSEELALKVATQFGGGARKGEMCGSVSGALMVLGLKYGFSDVKERDKIDKAHSKAAEFMERFIEAKGTVVCRELLGYDISKEIEIIREIGLFDSVCPGRSWCISE